MPNDLKKMMWTILGGVALIVVTNCMVLISDHFTLQRVDGTLTKLETHVDRDIEPKVNELWYARRTAKAGTSTQSNLTP